MGAALCVTSIPFPIVEAASPMGTFATIIMSERTVRSDGCFDVYSLYVSASSMSTDSRLLVWIDLSKQCGNLFETYFHAEAPSVSLVAGELAALASTQGFGIHATVPAIVFDGSNWSDSSLRVDIDIANPHRGDPRLDGNFSATASGTITGGASVDFDGTVWTGLPLPGQLNFAAADIIKAGAHGETGPPPIIWPDWRRTPATWFWFSCDPNVVGSTASATLTVWATKNSLNGFSIHVDAACLGSVELAIYSFDASMPDGSLDPGKVTVIRALPGTDYVAGPSTIASLGLTGAWPLLGIAAGMIPPGTEVCAGFASTTDFIVVNNEIQATSC